MTRRRWIADEFSSSRAALTGAHADHLIRVLRARIGQVFDIIADGAVRRGRISRIREQRVEFELGEETHGPQLVPITLVLAIFRFERMEWAIEKCTELGVSRIVPLIAQRTDPHLARAAGKRAERWRRIARQATEQSRRSVRPELVQPVRLDEAVALPGATRILLAEQEHRVSLKHACANHRPEDELVVAVGPEGGWTDEEQALFLKSSWISASLGQTILRAETAAIAAVAILVAQLSSGNHG